MYNGATIETGNLAQVNEIIVDSVKLFTIVLRDSNKYADLYAAVPLVYNGTFFNAGAYVFTEYNNDSIPHELNINFGIETLSGTWRFKYTGVWEINGKTGWIPEY